MSQFKEFFSYLLTLSITSAMLIPYQSKDKQGKVTSLTLFIPWRLASGVDVAKLNSILPEGWIAKESRKIQHQQEALDSKVDYTPSIAISEMADSAVVLEAWLTK